MELVLWLAATPVARFVRHSTWGWPVLEILHFMGLSLILGTIGVFDLRLMGWARAIPPAALHRAVPIGIAGFCVNVITGAMFFAAEPFFYIGNIAFEIKMALMVCAGINVAVFYLLLSRRVMTLERGDQAPTGARLVGVASLLLWMSILVAGRMEAFFKPLGP